MGRLAPSLLASVALTSLVVVIGIGVVVGLLLQQSVRDSAIRDAARTGEVAANVGVRPFLEVADLERNFMPLPDERIDELDDSLGDSLSPNGIVRLKLWNRQHWLVYSDNEALRGRWFAGADTLEQSFDGELTSEITDLSAPEEREERDFGELLAVYVPLRASDGEFTRDMSAPVVGAFEIYLPWAPIAADIRADTIRLWGTLAVSLLVLYLALFQLVRRASQQLRKKTEQNLYIATHDSLTGLANRDAFYSAIAQRLEEPPAGGLANVPVVMLFDLDDFQMVNDTLGHEVGDRLIQTLGHRLGTLAGSGETVCRMGGDEFGLLIPHIRPDEVEATVAMYAEALNTTVELEGLRVEVNASVGAVVIDHGMTADEALQRVDIAMYEAKRRRSGVEFYRDGMDTFTADSLVLAGEIRRGIEHDEFVLHYQPKYQLATGRIIGAEALVRWNHPERGFVPPGAFIPMTEQLPIGRELTEWILRRAVSDMARWRARGLDLGVSVNLSARDVADPTIVDSVTALLQEHPIDASKLTLELTEGTVLADEDRAIASLERLRLLGCGIAIDDFGTGYASISYLMRLPATELKVDQSFVGKLDTDLKSRQIVSHCVGIANSLGLSITAEGIETEAIELLARDLGCTEAQGYLRGRPMPIAEFLAAILKRPAPVDSADLLAKTTSSAAPTAPNSPAPSLATSGSTA